MLPIELLCITHRLLAQKDFSGLLAHQIDVIRRTGCECDLEMLWLWYDLIGFEYDILDTND